jgi:hypothetical protein
MVIPKAIELKVNFIIALEPTFYSHMDETASEEAGSECMDQKEYFRSSCSAYTSIGISLKCGESIKCGSKRAHQSLYPFQKPLLNRLIYAIFENSDI